VANVAGTILCGLCTLSPLPRVCVLSLAPLLSLASLVLIPLVLVPLVLVPLIALIALVLLV
jgi:hypothetical protein